MAEFDRRQFLRHGGNAGLGLAAAAMTDTARADDKPASPAERLTLAVIGLRGRGRHLAHDFAARKDCRVAYLCDVDLTVPPTQAKEIEQSQGSAPRTVQDFRRALDDKSVDAVVIATPDHWHALATVWACQAGKDVYVEKPVSHSPWEGRQMVKAARKYDRIVQAGTQNRSAPYIHAAKDYLDSGKLGSIHLVRVFNQKYQDNPQPAVEGTPPAQLDWNMWTGPAPLSSYNANDHRRWNCFWRYSGGDVANDAVHQLDLARWLTGQDYPRTVYATGGRFAETGVAESPDTQIAVYEFPKLVMTFELTLYTPYMIKSDAGIRDGDLYPYWPQNTERVEIFGSKGLMVVGRMGAGWQVFDRQKDRQPVIVAQQHGKFPDPEHQQNFVDAVRSRKLPNADIEQGHRSTLLCHYANISYRLGSRKLTIDPATESFVDDAEANGYLKREYRAPWIVPDVV